MYGHRVIALLVLLASMVSAVGMDTAFVRDYVQYLTPGFLETTFIGAEEFVSLEGEGILTRRKITNAGAGNTIDSELVWAVDIRSVGADDALKVHVGSNSVFVYGPNLDLTVVDLEDGVVVSVDKTQGRVTWVGCAPSGNVYGLTKTGHVILVNDDGSIKRIDLARHSPLAAGTTVQLASVGGVDYGVLSNGYVLKLTDLAEEIGQVALVKSVSGSAIVTDSNQVFEILPDGTLVEIKHRFNQPTVLNSQVIVDINGKKLVFYKVQQDKTVVSMATRDESNVISNAYVVSNGEDVALAINLGPTSLRVLVLTDFLKTHESGSIKEFIRGSGQEFDNSKRSALFGANSTLLTSFIESSNLYVESTNWDTEKQYHGAIYNVTVDPESVLIVDKPNVATESLELALLATESSSILVNWVARTKRHLAAIGKFVTSVALDHKLPSDDHSGLFPEVDFGFDKLVLFFDPNSCRVRALNSKDGSLEWSTESFCTASDSKLLGMFIANGDLVVTLEQHVHRFNLHDGLKFGPARFTKYGYTDSIKVKATEDGRDTWVLRKGKEFTKYGPFDFASDQTIITNEDDVKLQAYISVKGKFVPTWSFGTKNEKIVKYIGKPEQSTTSSIGVVLHDKSVLYKYLYPNTIGVVTSDQDNVLSFYLLDGVKGEILYTYKHKSDESVDLDSVELLMDDNWVIYTYFVFLPRFEQRIAVLDLFDSAKLLSKDDKEEISAFDADLKISNVTQLAFTYPDRITKLKSTGTKHGITLKSVIAVTENGAVMEFPKWILNSRRVVGRDMTNEDRMSDFRPMPYEPVVARNTQQILNHKYKLFVDKNGTILTKDTNLESTSVVCYINSYNVFCSIAQPSRSWDLLGSNFDKNKLALTVLVLVVSYVVSTVFVSKKSVHDAWHDSS